MGMMISPHGALVKPAGPLVAAPPVLSIRVGLLGYFWAACGTAGSFIFKQITEAMGSGAFAGRLK